MPEELVIIVFEDQRDVAMSILEGISATLENTRTARRFVSYCDEFGALKRIPRLVNEAMIDLGRSGRKMIIVDLRNHPRGEMKHGIDVIDAIAIEMGFTGGVCELLISPDHLVVVSTVFASDLVEAAHSIWDLSEAPSVQEIHTHSDVNRFIRDKRERPILPVVDKAIRSDEGHGVARLNDLALGWIRNI